MTSIIPKSNFFALFPFALALFLFAGCEDSSFYYSANAGTTSFAIANNINDDIRVVYPSDAYTDDSTVYIPAHERNDVSLYYDATLGGDVGFTVDWGSRSRVYYVPYGTRHVTISEDDFR